MKDFLTRIYKISASMGFDILLFFGFLRQFPAFSCDYFKIKKQLKNNKDFKLYINPVLSDKSKPSGTAYGHYFHQDFLVARKIFENQPQKHIDIGSRVDGFIAHVAIFREIECFDIRPQNNTFKNVIFKKADLMQLPDELLDYCDSVSSLHAIEHFGLGRYNDKIDALGHLKAFENIYRILKKHGKFYYSCPMGVQRIEFNSHRVFSLDYLLKIFKEKFNIISFNYVDDQGNLLDSPELTTENIKNSFNCKYGCAIFEMEKI